MTGPQLKAVPIFLFRVRPPNDGYVFSHFLYFSSPLTHFLKLYVLVSPLSNPSFVFALSQRFPNKLDVKVIRY